MTEYINEKLTQIEYLKKVCFKFTNEQFEIVYIIFYHFYFVYLSDDWLTSKSTILNCIYYILFF